MSEDPELDALKLRFEDLRRENERLRDARSAITAQLGPLPISAAIVAGLVSGFALGGKTHLHERELHLALWLFGAMVLVSMLASTFRPYRKLRDKAIKGDEREGVVRTDDQTRRDAARHLSQVGVLGVARRARPNTRTVPGQEPTVGLRPGVERVVPDKEPLRGRDCAADPRRVPLDSRRGRHQRCRR
jgi:hypothetical protein